MTDENYTIITKRTIQELTKEVNKLISDNWAPIGGVSAVFAHDVLTYSQAMYKPLSGLRRGK